MRATSSGGFGSARGILERCCRPWPFWPRGTSNTTETEARAALGSPYIGSHQLLHYSRWPMANRMDEVPIVVLRSPVDVENVSVIRWHCRRTGAPNSFSKRFLQIILETVFINNIAVLRIFQIIFLVFNFVAFILVERYLLNAIISILNYIISYHLYIIFSINRIILSPLYGDNYENLIILIIQKKIIIDNIILSLCKWTSFAKVILCMVKRFIYI